MAHVAEISDRRSGRAPAGVRTRDRRPGPALGRDEVMRETLGGRTWRGALTNPTDRACADVTVRVRFLDRAGRVVGAPVGAHASWLEPGAALHLQARLPAEAAGLEIAALRWTAGGRAFDLGPGDPRLFGPVRA